MNSEAPNTIEVPSRVTKQQLEAARGVAVVAEMTRTFLRLSLRGVPLREVEEVWHEVNEIDMTERKSQ
jgi:hypothetical protein